MRIVPRLSDDALSTADECCVDLSIKMFPNRRLVEEIGKLAVRAIAGRK